NQKNEPRARNQVVTPRSTRRLDRTRLRRRSTIDFGKIISAAATFARPGALLVALALLIFGYNVLASSKLFQLHRVTIADAEPSVQSEIEQLIRRSVGQTTMMEVDLSALRQKIEAMPRIRSASVGRVLPDGVFVRVVQRQPAVLVRRESEVLTWLDEDGFEVGEFSDLKISSASNANISAEVPPIAKGFAEGNRSQAAIAEDRERIAL